MLSSCHHTPKDRFHLTDVYDFRFDAEVAGAPDREIEGVHNTHLSMLPQLLVNGFTAKDREKIRNKYMN